MSSRTYVTQKDNSELLFAILLSGQRAKSLTSVSTKRTGGGYILFHVYASYIR